MEKRTIKIIIISILSFFLIMMVLGVIFMIATQTSGPIP